MIKKEIEDEEYAIILEKLKIYYDKKIHVHLILKTTEWFNGPIIELADSYLMIDEYKKGRTPIILKQIAKVDTYFIPNYDTGDANGGKHV